jgi:hypothetical protein
MVQAGQVHQTESYVPEPSGMWAVSTVNRFMSVRQAVPGAACQHHGTQVHVTALWVY